MRPQTKRLADVIPAPALVVPEPAVTFTVAPEAVTALAPEPRDDGPVRLELGADELGPEGYRLEITAAGVTLRAAAPAGLFWGLQTLRQLAADDGVLPGGVIEDRPRFAYRGAMLDLARHFFTADEIRAHVDLLAQFKINHLHLHLTDDQGWRLEIPGWPRLTEVGGGPGTGCDGAGPGYLTLAEYAEVVAYAAERFVTVVPEIDMPGHVNAALVAYPELTADGQPVAPRTDAEVGYSSLVAGKEETYAFVEAVLKAVADATPGPFLHIGGDECLSTSAEDYRAFLTRVLPLPAKYGKRPVGWHEIAAVDLPEGAVVQYWRPQDEGTEVAAAVAAGHQVIMSPADRTYLDMKYDETTPIGLDWAGLVPVRRAYDWDPADRLPGVPETALLGVAAPLWSETLRSVADLQYLTFPRLPAVAEVAWTPQAGRDWASFRERLAGFGPRWDAAGVTWFRAPEIDWPAG
ncbi:hexosaminidase [Actinoplanes octamycinicus]|uniref:beta-N-acetylhexosaminidase n=1 Tax=Actinoplanes octamycinicus TaxID=135948 RepID=A0A7W7GVX9_9ACTN|nr:family 20 glycosylhydrolase [Actinoplanes octamycinicus]MBB4739301.1 hexosaminidase [Actinoplanes octamycinicus]GIE58723.1 beta-N-acetylhexosaminidase [Actinoplanes octamycinicus]